MRINYVNKQKAIYSQVTYPGSRVTVTDQGKQYDVGMLIRLVDIAKVATIHACDCCDIKDCDRCAVTKLVEMIKEVEK